MSQDMTVVPAEAQNRNLTPTQRFEAIVRSQSGMAEYVAPRETGEATTRDAARTAVVEHAEYLNRAKDARGLVSARDYVRGGTAYTFGYDLPDGVWGDPAMWYEILSCAAEAKIPKQHVFNWLVAVGRRVGAI